MELKVWVEGIQRIVCGATEKTTCQDVVYALAHATGKTGRFTLIERWRNNERLLAPQEHPVKVLNKWGEYSHDVQFILQRSSLEGAKGNQAPPNGPGNPVGPYRQGQMSGGDLQRMNYPAHGAMRPPLMPSTGAHLGKSQNHEPAAVWKPPPPHHSGAGLSSTSNSSYGVRKGHPYPMNSNSEINARLSPDSGRGSDKTGSDTSNSYTDKDNVKNNNTSKKHAASSQQPYIPPTMNGGYGMGPPNNNFQASASTSQLMWRLPPQAGGEESPYGFTKQTSMPVLKQQPPAYKPPPHPQPGPSSSSPADPPPYRNPPPPPAGTRYGGSAKSAGVVHGYHPSPPPQGGQMVRPPHYSPPPTHRVSHLSRHPSKTSLVGGSGSSGGPPPGQQRQRPNSQQMRQAFHRGRQGNPTGPPVDMTELLNLVTAQQSTLQAQQADIRQFEIEEAGFADHGGVGSTQQQQGHPTEGPLNGGSQAVPPLLSPGSQLDLVLSEVRRLEELSLRNDDELKFLNSERAQLDQTAASGAGDEGNIRGEIMQLKQRLAGTDVELQRTNTTLRRLGDEMRNMSLEKSRQREQELVQEMERLQSEIKSLQKSSEDSANISQQLSKDVKDVEEQIRQRKSEVEQLIKEMREANMESLAISPPEESKQFLDGPPKPGSSRKMMGSPRQLENAVPTSRNPHGVWV